MQLNHNAVRQHLAVLKDAELVVEEANRVTARGAHSALPTHPEAAGKRETPGAYTWLAGLLGEAMKRDLILAKSVTKKAFDEG